MPIVSPSSYAPPGWLVNGHLQTLFPALLRKVTGIRYQRERIATPDGDFLDLDGMRQGAARTAVIAHGLEGNSRRAYVLGMVKALFRQGWDVVVWNARGCSGVPNCRLRFTHSGATEDLQAVISHLAATRNDSEMALVGFSLGGNLTLKYLGDCGRKLHARIKRAVVFSVPCDLRSSSGQLATLPNQIYLRHFLWSLRRKIRARMQAMPGTIDDRDYAQLRTFQDFDDRYTAPIHGFADAADYWRRCSCLPVLKSIAIPTLLINAVNDPFLAPACYPIAEATANPYLHLEMPASGGHVGFVSFNQQEEYWSESRAISFLK